MSHSFLNFLSIALVFSSTAFAGKTVYRPTSHHSYLTRLLEKDPGEYINCMKKGPTPEHEAGVLCAKATRSILNCARPQDPEVHCGGYAFNYYGKQCMEKRGYINLLEHSKDGTSSICQVPGAMWVFYGRCTPEGGNTLISTQDCHEKLKLQLGEAAYKKEMDSKIALYTSDKYNMTEAEAWSAAVAGDRYGHMDLIGYKYDPDAGVDGEIYSNIINFWTYIVIPIPASHNQRTGAYQGHRILKACYMPADDARVIIQEQ